MWLLRYLAVRSQNRSPRWMNIACVGILLRRSNFVLECCNWALYQQGLTISYLLLAPGSSFQSSCSGSWCGECIWIASHVTTYPEQSTLILTYSYHWIPFSLSFCLILAASGWALPPSSPSQSANKKGLWVCNVLISAYKCTSALFGNPLVGPGIGVGKSPSCTQLLIPPSWVKASAFWNPTTLATNMRVKLQ